MAQKIYRFEIEVEDEPVLLMPQGARVLSCAPGRGEDASHVDIWALVNPEVSQMAERRFLIRGTGHVVPENVATRFVGTFALAEGRFIGHLFELDDAAGRTLT